MQLHDRHCFLTTTPVIYLFRDDPPDPAPRVGTVIGKARYEVDVQVRNGLPSSRAVVDSDVVALRLELSIHDCLGSTEQRQQSCTFVTLKLKEGTNMSVGDDEGVAR